MAGARGIEPLTALLESDVIPLHQAPMKLPKKSYSVYQLFSNGTNVMKPNLSRRWFDNVGHLGARNL